MGPTGSIKPDKKKSIEKIDGMSALLNAISRAMTYDPEAAGTMYDNPEIANVGH